MTLPFNHLSCPAYPDCDEWPLGCREVYGNNAEPAGHRDAKCPRCGEVRDSIESPVPCRDPDCATLDGEAP